MKPCHMEHSLFDCEPQKCKKLKLSFSMPRGSRGITLRIPNFSIS